MMPGPSEIKECPYCNGHIIFTTIASGNTFFQSRWSDGYVYFPMMPVTEEVYRCPFCSNFLWTDDLKFLGYDDQNSFFDFTTADTYKRDKKHKLKAPVSLRENDYYEIIDTEMNQSLQDEINFRIKAWRLSNDPFRNKPAKKKPVRSETARKNMEDLLIILIECGGEYSTIAELFRELDRFDEAIENLRNIKSNDEWTNRIKGIMIDLCGKKISDVIQLDEYYKEFEDLHKEDFNNYVQEAMKYVRNRAIELGLADEKNVDDAILKMSVEDFTKLRGKYKELTRIHWKGVATKT